MTNDELEQAILDRAVARISDDVDEFVSSRLAAAVAEVERLRAEVDRLRASRDEWMERSNAHAIEAGRHRVTIVNLRGRIYELENHR